MPTVSGGDKARQILARIAANLSKASAVEVGFLEDAKYPDGTSVALVAALDEFGNGRAPPRPYFRRMIKSKSGGWAKGLGVQLKLNEFDAKKSLEALGMVVKGQLQESINELWDPPLAPSTVARKGHDKPLIDTSHMINSADYRVK